MAEDIPPLDAESSADSGNVACVVLDTCRSRPWWLLGFSAASLIEEHELSLSRERSKRGPEHFVTEVQSSVDAKKGGLPLDGRTEVNSESESARKNGAVIEKGSFSLHPPESEEPRTRCAMLSHSVKLTRRGD